MYTIGGLLYPLPIVLTSIDPTSTLPSESIVGAPMVAPPGFLNDIAGIKSYPLPLLVIVKESTIPVTSSTVRLNFAGVPLKSEGLPTTGIGGL